MFAVCFTVVLGFTMLFPVSSLAQGRNSIEGRVTTTDNKSLDNVRVFLLNDSYGQRAQTYTNGSGRYQFSGLGPGNYYIQVEPAGTGYERQTQRVEVNPYDPAGRGGAEIFRFDIVLKPEKPARSGNPISDVGSVPPRIIFVQNIPPAAREAYQRGLESLKKEDLKNAEIGLTKAIELFPDYYDALETLGTEYVRHAYYDAATPLLGRAIEINRNAWHSYYGLGVSLIELGKRQEGIEALRRAVGLNPKSVNAAMRLGIELAKEDQYTDEAIKLLSNVTQMAGKQLPEAYLTLASLHSKNKQYSQAAEALESYLLSSPTVPQRENIKHKIDELRQKENKSAKHK
jgi:tetratricopeptide (TPR) repeat protein